MIVTILRTVILYVIVVVSIRLMGKRQVGEMQPSELVVTLLISELAAIPMQDLNSPVLSGVVAIVMLVILELILSVLILKYRPFRRAVAGKPAILIQNGVIDQKKMNQLRLSPDDLMEDLRQAGYFKLQDIAWAIMETNGKLSVLPREASVPPTRCEMKIAAPDSGPACSVICDGKIEKESLKICNVSPGEIREQLVTKRLSIEDVYLMTADINGNFIIIRKEK